MLNIIVPLAGRGQSFETSGYIFPKPLVEIKGKPMIQVVVQNTKPAVDHRYIFIIRREHEISFSLKEVLQQVAKNCEVITLDNDTQGSGCSVLLASCMLNPDEPVLVLNGDQYVEFDVNHFISVAQSGDHDGLVLTFSSYHPRWSYVSVDNDNIVVEAAEKKPISNHATAGLYYFSKAGEMVAALKNMIRKNAAFNGQYYISPAYNELVLAGKSIAIYEIDSKKMHGLGTPEELKLFESKNLALVDD